MSTAVATTKRTPRPLEVQSTVSDLLGTTVTVSPAAPFVVRHDRLATVAVYTTDDGAEGVLVLCDLSLAAGAGAALAMLERAEAEAGVRDGTVDEALLENLHEVLNVMTSLLNPKGGSRVKLRALHAPPLRLANDVRVAVLRPEWRLDLDVAITGYPGGGLSFLASPVPLPSVVA